MSSRASSTAARPSSSSARVSAIWRARSLFDRPEAPRTHPAPAATSTARPIRRMNVVVAMSEFLYSHGNARGAFEHVPFETPESRACCDTCSARVIRSQDALAFGTCARGANEPDSGHLDRPQEGGHRVCIGGSRHHEDLGI